MLVSKLTPGREPTIHHHIHALREQGFTHTLQAAPEGRVRCLELDASRPASELVIEAQRRLEGSSEPGGQCVVLGVRWPRDGVEDARGVLVLGYRPSASVTDGAVLERLRTAP